MTDFDITPQVAEVLNKVLPPVAIPPDGVSPLTWSRPSRRRRRPSPPQPAAAPANPAKPRRRRSRRAEAAFDPLQPQDAIEPRTDDRRDVTDWPIAGDPRFFQRAGPHHAGGGGRRGARPRRRRAG